MAAVNQEKDDVFQVCIGQCDTNACPHYVSQYPIGTVPKCSTLAVSGNVPPVPEIL